MHNYHSTFGSFPPAFVADESGKPIHSWRVLLLPYLGENVLYASYRFDEPWNGPNNSKLLDRLPDLYRCPLGTTSQRHTSYVAVVGAGTLWPGKTAVSITEILDGTVNTIALIEVADSGIQWLEPRDLPKETAVVDGTHRLVATVDGATHSLESIVKLNAGVFQSALTIQGQEAINVLIW